MPRQSSRRAPVSRPSQARHASTMAAPRSAAVSAPPPPAAAAAPAPVAAAPQQPGLFANMASTAAGVAVGSAVGHTLGAGLTSLFGGSSAPAAVEQQQVVPASSSSTASEGIKSCEVDARAFTKCLDDNSGNMQICDWYLQQLKSCQEAARQY